MGRLRTLDCSSACANAIENRCAPRWNYSLTRPRRQIQRSPGNTLSRIPVPVPILPSRKRSVTCSGSLAGLRLQRRAVRWDLEGFRLRGIARGPFGGQVVRGFGLRVERLASSKPLHCGLQCLHPLVVVSLSCENRRVPEQLAHRASGRQRSTNGDAYSCSRIGIYCNLVSRRSRSSH